MDRTRDQIASDYDQYFTKNPDKWGGPARDEFMLAKLAKYDEPARIIDVGCGNGHSLAALAKAFPMSELYALDPSLVALNLTQGRVPDVNLIQGLIEDVEGTFDLVVCLGTAEHFSDLDAGLKDLRRITRDLCYLEIPHNLLYSPGKHEYRQLETRSRQYEWHLERDEWEQKLADAGFEIVERLTGKNEAWEFIWVLR